MLFIANVIVFFVTFLPSFSTRYWFPALLGAYPAPAIFNVSKSYGLIPNNVLHGNQLYTVFTSIFLHADLIHLGGNMLFLYIFGDNVEDTFGHVRYLMFYFLAGVAASFAHILFVANTLEGAIPTIGASGAISGIMGAYLVLFPRSRILTLVLLFWISIAAIPAVIFLGLWFIFQFLYGTLAVGGGVAYWAHIGGFISGIVFLYMLKPRKSSIFTGSSGRNMGKSRRPSRRRGPWG